MQIDKSSNDKQPKKNNTRTHYTAHRTQRAYDIVEDSDLFKMVKSVERRVEEKRHEKK